MLHSIVVWIVQDTLISGFHRDVYEICALLGYYVASCGNCLPTFRDNVSVPSSRVKSPSRKERKPATYNADYGKYGGVAIHRQIVVPSNACNYSPSDTALLSRKTLMQKCTQGGGAVGPPNRNLKNTYFVETMITNVLRDLPFSGNQPLKSADD
jgi:hypothetical protein